VYIIYIRERSYFSVVCTFRKAIKYIEAKVDVPKGPLKFREFDNRCVSFIPFKISSIVIVWLQSSMIALVHSC
jgi:hypothetical protein